MKTKFYSIKCVTNMYVGSGDSSYSIIDGRVERDSILNTPIIPSSSLKGALRDYFENELNIYSEFVKEIFGSKPMDNNNNACDDNIKGKVHFLSANMIFRPMRVESGKQPYCMVTTCALLKNMFNIMSDMGYDVNDYLDYLKDIDDFFDKTDHNIYGICSEDDIQIEGYNMENDKGGILEKIIQIVKDMTGNNDIAISIMKNQKYESIDLPIVARNYLENGVSKNLWYEELVPHKSIFYFSIVYPDDINKEYLNEFNNVITNNIMRFGGGASIGYGYCIVNEFMNIDQGGTNIVK